ncbi:MAG: putative GntR-family transcriptional regulator [Glaciihabitans sp.]|jgi:DNA-binding FadR family transcriptional regulator|nr:putative GntR-family transcriptional regulator [Glaciihabitans sp.]
MTPDPTDADVDNTAATDDRYRPGYELVAEQLLHYVADEGLQAGDRLPTEQGLAEILGATRNVTREAVKVLAALGRLNVRKGAGIFMAEPRSTLAEELLTHFQPTDIDHVVMLLDHRRLIEAETARRSASLATPAEVRAIREGAQRSIAESRVDNVNEFAEADAQFHKAIAVAAHNVFLEASVTSLRRYAAQSDLLVFHGDVPGSFEVAANQHLAIATAIANGEPDLAATLMEEHVDTTRHQFERKLKDRMFNFDRTNDNRPS